MKRVWVGTLVLCALGACGDDSASKPDGGVPDGGGDGGSADAAAPDSGPTCTKRWTREFTTTGTTATATVAGGALVVSSTNTSGAPLAVTQNGLTGDFNAVFHFEGFATTGTGGFVQAVVSSAGQADVAVAGIGTSPTVGVSAAFLAPVGGPTMLTPSTEKTGTMRFARTGSNLVITTTTAAGTATASGAFTTGSLKIGLQIGSNNGTVAGPTTIQITDFTIAGGGGTVTADDFSCDSLR